MKQFTPLIVVIGIFLCASLPAAGQFYFLDSSKAAFRMQPADTNKILNGLNISFSYAVLNPDSALYYAQECLSIARKLKNDRFIFWGEASMADALSLLGNYPKELDYCFKVRARAQKSGSNEEAVHATELLSNYYYNLGEYRLCRDYIFQCKKITDRVCPESTLPIWVDLAKVYEGMNRPDSAIYFCGLSIVAWQKKTFALPDWAYRHVQSNISLILGNAYNQLHNYDSALLWFHQGMKISKEDVLKLDQAEQRVGIAASFRARRNFDSARYYANMALEDSISHTYPIARLKALNVIAGIYESEQRTDSALKYLRMAGVVKDSLFNRAKMVAIQQLTNEEQEREKLIESDNLKMSNRYGILLLLAGFISMSLAALVVLRWQRLRQLKKLRNSIADDLHDDIGSTLSSISIMSELAKVKSPDALSLLTSIEENAISLQENMSDIVWAVNPQNDRFENVFQRMNEFASGILDARQIGFDFHSDPSLDSVRLSMAQRKNLYLFFKEAINNAAKYSGATRVSVSIGRKDNRIFMNIRDDGRGFDTVVKVNGHGMLTLKKRREELGGELKIDSHPGRGTAVDLKFRIT